MALYRSTVKWFDAKKGYGFLVHPETGEDVFVHYSQIESDKRFKTLRTGQPVEYELARGTKGLHAVSIRPVEEPGDRDSYQDESDGDGESGTDDLMTEPADATARRDDGSQRDS